MQAKYASGAMTARPHSTDLAMLGSIGSIGSALLPNPLQPHHQPHPPQPLFREQTELQAFAQTVRKRGFLDSNRRLARMGVRRPDEKFGVDEGRLRELLNKIKIVDNENSHLKLELGVLLRKGHRKRDDELDQAMEETRSLQLDIQNAAVEKELLSQSQKELEAQLTRRTQEYTRIEAKHSDLLAQFHELGKQHKHLQIMHSHVNKDIEIATQDKVFLEATCARLAMENGDLKKSHKQLRERNLQLKAQNDNYGSSFDKNAREYEEAQRKLDEATKALDAERTAKQHALDELNGERVAAGLLKAQLVEKKKDLDLLSSNMLGVTKELNDLKNTAFELGQKTSRQTRELHNTTEELAHVRQTLVEEVTTLTERANRCQGRMENALEKHKLCEPLQEQLYEEIRALKSEREKNNRELEHTREENKYFAKKNKESTKEIKDLQKERRLLTQKLDEGTKKIKGLEETTGQKKQALAETTHNLHVAMGEKSRNLAQIETLTKQLKKMSSNHQDCPATIKHLGSEIILKTQLYTSQLAQLRTDVQNESTKCMALQRQLNSWRKRADDGERITKDLNERLKVMTENEKKMAKDVHLLEEQKHAMQYTVDTITMELQKANTTIAQQTKELGALTEVTQLVEKVKKAEEAKGEVSTKLEQALAEIAEKNELIIALTTAKQEG